MWKQIQISYHLESNIMYSFAFCLFIELSWKENKKRKKHTQKKRKKKSEPSRIRTGDVSITNPGSYHWTDWQVVESPLKKE